MLVAAPVLLRELEQKKAINSSSRLKDRAADYIKWLHKFVRHPETEVRAGVRWWFLPDEPQLDFTAERLSQSIADDHLIASILHYTSQLDGSVLVATADIGLEVKLRSRAISVLELPVDLRLPDEPDPVELENRNLRLQIARFEARMPRLSVNFKGGSQHHALYLREPNASLVTSLEQIRADNPYIDGTQAAPSTQDRFNAAFDEVQRLTKQFSISAERVDKFNEELERYFSQYQLYLKNHAVWSEMLSLHHQVKIVISNDGTAPATNIDLDLSFPDGIRPIDKDDIPKEPKAPKAPRRPRGIMEIHGFGDSDYLSSLTAQDLHSMINSNYDGQPIVDKVENSIRIGYPTLKHGFRVTTDNMIFRFADATTVHPFSVGFHLSADELPEALKGQLHFRIDDTEA